MVAQFVAAPSGSPNATPGGWGTGQSPWDATPILWHDGSDGHDHSLIYVSPSENLGMVRMANEGSDGLETRENEVAVELGDSPSSFLRSEEGHRGSLLHP
jgi:hypothetical protein